jgi:ATP sulfurylase (sulfate adenylyltransferase)
MSRDDYESVCHRLRSPMGRCGRCRSRSTSPKSAPSLESGARVALREPEGRCLAVLHVEDIWQPDRDAEARLVFGTTDAAHPGVAALAAGHPFGSVDGSRRWTSPFTTISRRFGRRRCSCGTSSRRNGWQRVVAFQTRNPMHRAHVELTRRAIEETGARLLIHPVVGMTKPGDVDHFTRVRCYQVALQTYDPGMATLALLPLAMRMAGPREALSHAIIRRNYGCTHLIVGRDHAGPAATPPGGRSTVHTMRSGCFASTKPRSACRWSPRVKWSTWPISPGTFRKIRCRMARPY